MFSVKHFSAVAAASMALLSLPASAALFPSGSVKLSDDSAESLIKGTGNTQANVVEVGDRLRGIFDINGWEQPPANGSIGGVATNELTGIFELQIVEKKTSGQAMNAGGTCSSTFCFVFGPSASFAAEMSAKGFSNTTGATVAFFEDVDGNDFNRGISTGNVAADIAAMEATATDGNLFWLAGFATTFDFWNAFTTTDNIGFASVAAEGTPFGQFGFGQSLLDNPTGPDLGLVSCTNTNADLSGPPFGTGLVQYCGNGGLFAKGPSGAPGSFETAYDSLDDVNFNINVIPEPSSIALAGLALLGLGAAARRRKA